MFGSRVWANTLKCDTSNVLLLMKQCNITIYLNIFLSIIYPNSSIKNYWKCNTQTDFSTLCNEHVIRKGRQSRKLEVLGIFSLIVNTLTRQGEKSLKGVRRHYLRFWITERSFCFYPKIWWEVLIEKRHVIEELKESFKTWIATKNSHKGDFVRGV